jgi:hypothetical protein
MSPTGPFSPRLRPEAVMLQKGGCCSVSWQFLSVFRQFQHETSRSHKDLIV